MVGPEMAVVEARSPTQHSPVSSERTAQSRLAPGSFLATDAVFQPVRAGNAFEETVERLLQAIKLGLVRRGERLPAERELAPRLGVSRVTLREGIRALQQAGYVESRRGRFGGTFVVYTPDCGGVGRRVSRAMAEQLSDTLLLRQVLEVGTAAAAAEAGVDESGRVYLTDRLAEVERADPAGYRQADSRLHLAVAELTGAPSLIAAVADVRMRLNDLLDAFPLLDRNIEHSNAQHAAVVAAILAGDADGARQAMTEHVEGSAALLRGFLG